MGKSFIFGGSTGLTYADLKRQQEIADQLAVAGSGAPQNIAQGLSQLGAALGSRIASNRAGKGRAAGREAFSTEFNSALGLGPTTPPSPAPSGATFSHSANSAARGQTSPSQVPVADSATELASSKQSFIDALLPEAIEVGRRTGIDPRIIVAQAAQETGWGKSAPNNNFFGIKSHGKAGGQTFSTHEVINGKRIETRDDFRRYESPEGSVRGYGDFITDNPRYEPFRAAEGLDSQLAELQKSGYATDPNYSKSVGAIARSISTPGTQEAPIPPENSAPQNAGPQGMRGIDPQLLALAQNPFATPFQKQMVGNLIKQQMAQNAPPSRAHKLAEREFQFEQKKFETQQSRPVSVGGNLVNPQTGEPVYQSPQKPMTVGGNLINPETGQVVYQSPLKPTSSIQEYQFYKRQTEANGGTPIPYNEFTVQQSNAKASRTNISVGGEPSDSALRKKLNEKTGELWSTYQQQGAISSALTQDLEVLDELITLAPQGPITGRLAGAFSGISSAGDAFQSIVKRIAPTLRAPGSGSTSDIEYDGMLRSLPSLSNRPEANVMIAQILRAKSALNTERAGIVSSYASGKLTAGQAQTAMSELDQRSIMTPEMHRAFEGLGAVPSQPTVGPDGWADHGNGVRIRKKQ